MQKLTNIRPLVNITILVSIVVGICILLFALTASKRRITPPPAYLNTESNENLSTDTSKITLDTSKIDTSKIPSTLKVYAIETEPNLLEMAQLYAETLNIPRQPNVANLWSNEEGTRTLSYSQSSNAITYTNSVTPSSERVDETKALSIANNFLNNLKISNQFKLLENNTKYLKLEPNAFHFEEATKETANLAKFFFSQTIDGYPLFLETNQNNTLDITADNLSITKVTFFAYHTIGESLGNGKTLSMEEIAAKLKEGKGVINRLKTNTLVADREALYDIVLTDLKLEYRSSATTGLIYPYFNLSGTAMTDGEYPSEINIIIEAVETTEQ